MRIHVDIVLPRLDHQRTIKLVRFSVVSLNVVYLWSYIVVYYYKTLVEGVTYYSGIRNNRGEESALNEIVRYFNP